MKLIFRHIPLTAALLAFAAACYAADGRETAALLSSAITRDKSSDSRCAAIEALGPSRDAAVLKGLAGLLNDPDSSVRSCAIRAAGESKNELAVAPLLANIESYLASDRNMGPYENNLKARLKAIDSIWSLGEIGDPGVMEKFVKFYAESDDILRVNLVISMGKFRKADKAGPYLATLAASVEEAGVVRAAAFEMLAEIGWNTSMISLAPSKRDGIEKADLIYTGGRVGNMNAWVSPDLPVGHTGIFAGTEVKNGRINVVIGDCVTNDKVPGGVRNIYSWKNFTNQFRYPYYGNRTTLPKPTAAQRNKIVELALAMGKMGHKYDATHLSQKGPVEFDCVGYTEYIYEQAGVNPTPDYYESGLGWPLTPWEQFEATRPNLPPQSVKQADSASLQPRAAAPDLNLILKNFGALTGAFAVKAAQPANVNTAIHPAAADQ